MGLLQEWFLWGESDLFFYGVAIILISIFFPWKKEKKRRHYLIILICLIVYGISELVVTFWWQNWMCTYVCLFAGGIAFSIALGRIIKMCWSKIRKR